MPALTELPPETLKALEQEAVRDARIFERVRRAMAKVLGEMPTADPTVAEALDAETLERIFKEATSR